MQKCPQTLSFSRGVRYVGGRRFLQMKMKFLWRDPGAAGGFNTAVSLHSHTACSIERMEFLPAVLRAAPFGIGKFALHKFEEHHRSRNDGRGIDFSRAYWTPPLDPVSAYKLERDQIARSLGLRPLVSLTDHDSITACLEVRKAFDRDAPVSFEWTVPFRDAKFHLGIHNLPPEEAASLHAWLFDYQEAPNEDDLLEALGELSGRPGVLTVLNHPFSDEGRIGRRMHDATLLRFLDTCGQWVHALELNALQPWADNVRVITLAKERGYPVISGGDRHGLEPNGNLNLTNADTFSAFVDEIRTGHSRIVFMPQCERNIALRYAMNVYHILRPREGRHWYDKVFYRCDDGMTRPLGDVLKRNGAVISKIDAIVWFMGFLAGSPAFPLAHRIWRRTPTEINAMVMAFSS
jgi:hypothetical protein